MLMMGSLVCKLNNFRKVFLFVKPNIMDNCSKGFGRENSMKSTTLMVIAYYDEKGKV